MEFPNWTDFVGIWLKSSFHMPTTRVCLNPRYTLCTWCDKFFFNCIIGFPTLLQFGHLKFYLFSIDFFIILCNHFACIELLFSVNSECWALSEFHRNKKYTTRFIYVEIVLSPLEIANLLSSTKEKLQIDWLESPAWIDLVNVSFHMLVRVVFWANFSQMVKLKGFFWKKGRFFLI